MLNLDARVTATEASTGLPGVSVALIGMWVRLGKLHATGRRGRSPLYRWGDILIVERDTAASGKGRPRG